MIEKFNAKKGAVMAKTKKKKHVPARDLAAKKNVKGGGTPRNRLNTPITNIVDLPK